MKQGPLVWMLSLACAATASLVMLNAQAEEAPAILNAPLYLACGEDSKDAEHKEASKGEHCDDHCTKKGDHHEADHGDDHDAKHADDHSADHGAH